MGRRLERRTWSPVGRAFACATLTLVGCVTVAPGTHPATRPAEPITARPRTASLELLLREDTPVRAPDGSVLTLRLRSHKHGKGSSLGHYELRHRRGRREATLEFSATSDSPLDWYAEGSLLGGLVQLRGRRRGVLRLVLRPGASPRPLDEDALTEGAEKAAAPHLARLRAGGRPSSGTASSMENGALRISFRDSAGTDLLRAVVGQWSGEILYLGPPP